MLLNKAGSGPGQIAGEKGVFRAHDHRAHGVVYKESYRVAARGFELQHPNCFIRRQIGIRTDSPTLRSKLFSIDVNVGVARAYADSCRPQLRFRLEYGFQYAVLN